MTNRISNNAKRKLEILDRAATIGCAVNIKWCFALVQEQAMKELLRSSYVRLNRHSAGGRKRITIAEITPDGKKYREKLKKFAKYS